MDVRRGISSTFLIPARDLYANYLFVFQRVDDPTLYQYSITQSTGSAAGPLLLELSEVDSATAVDGEVTLGVGDWNVSVYGQASASNLDASLSSALVHTEQVTVLSDDVDPATYPPEGGGSGSAPDADRCRYVRVCGTPTDGQVITWDATAQEYTPETPSSGPGGGITDHGALSGLADDDHTQYHNNARGDARYDAIGAAAAAQAAAISTASSDATTKANAAQAAAIAAAASDATTKANAAQAAAIAASQPVDSDLTAIAALTTTAYGRALLELANAAAGRTAFGLGTAAVSNTGDFDAAGSAAAAQAASQPLDSDLTAIAALTTTAYGRAFLALADAAAGRTALGLGTLATQSGTFSGTSSGTNTGDQDLSAYQTIAALAGSVRSTVLTGLSLATSQVIAATDTVLQAFGYLQAQISALTTTVSGKLTAASNLSDLASAATARTNLNVIHAHRDTVGSGQTTTSTTLASITGLSLDVDANEHVSIHVRVLFEVSSTSGGIGLGINGSTAAAYFAGRFESLQSAGNFAQQLSAYSATTNATTCPAANTVYYAEIHAELVNGASASTITPMVARGGSGTLTIRAASIEITRS